MVFKSYSLKARKKRADIALRVLKQLFPKSSTILTYKNPLELLIAVMLSAQTTDKQVNKVTQNLFKKYTSLADYLQASLQTFEKDIASIGLYKSKARNIIAALRRIHEVYGGKLPLTLSKLLTLPGVGRKTAHVVMGHVCGQVEGIAVDTHVMRLARKWGLTKAKTQDGIEKDLMELLPREEWASFTNRVIDYGRSYSPAHKKEDVTDPVSAALLAAGT